MREPYHKLQEKQENLHTWNSTITSTILLMKMKDEFCHQHPPRQGSPIKHPEMKVENKSTTAVEFHGPSSSGASQ